MIDPIAQRHWRGEDLRPLIIWKPDALTIGEIKSTESDLCAFFEQIQRFDDNLDDLYDDDD